MSSLSLALPPLIEEQYGRSTYGVGLSERDFREEWWKRLPIRRQLVARLGYYKDNSEALRARLPRVETPTVRINEGEEPSTPSRILQGGRAKLWKARGLAPGEFDSSRVYIKFGFDAARISDLYREALHYETKLYPLQGEVVPRFLGFFTDQAMYPTFACSIFEVLVAPVGRVTVRGDEMMYVPSTTYHPSQQT